MNLSTRYLGLTLANPLVVGASPFCDRVDRARALQDAGAAALVMRSLFAEQIEPPPRARPAGSASVPEAVRVEYPEPAEYQLSPGQYLRQLDLLKRNLTIPVIASLNGHLPGDWVDFGRRLERAGADAIELNFYQVVTDPATAADQVETEMIGIVGRMATAVRIPVAVKLSPFHASVAQLAVALELAGAAGVVLFNRFHQPDVNIEEIAVQPQLRLSDPGELLLRLRWLAILAPQLRGTLIATGGIHSAGDLIKALLTGAHAAQVVSVLLKQGGSMVPTLLFGLRAWMERHGFTTIDQFRGMLDLRRCPDAAAYERANYIHALQQWIA